MRRPGLWIVIGLALALAGLVVAWLGLQAGRGMPAWQPGSRGSQSILQIGLALLIGGLILAGIACLVLRKRNQLERGEGVIAQWRIGLLDWDSFQRRDAARGWSRSIRRDASSVLRSDMQPPTLIRGRLPLQLPAGACDAGVTTSGSSRAALRWSARCTLPARRPGACRRPRGSAGG